MPVIYAEQCSSIMACVVLNVDLSKLMECDVFSHS